MYFNSGYHSAYCHATAKTSYQYWIDFQRKNINLSKDQETLHAYTPNVLCSHRKYHLHSHHLQALDFLNARHKDSISAKEQKSFPRLSVYVCFVIIYLAYIRIQRVNNNLFLLKDYFSFPNLTNWSHSVSVYVQYYEHGIIFSMFCTFWWLYRDKSITLCMGRTR